MSLRKAELEALRTLRIAWPERTIVLIGASALDRWLPLEHRQTHDIDLVVDIDPKRMQDDLVAHLSFQPDARLPYRFRAPSGARLDILAATAHELQSGELRFSESGIVLNLTGFDLAFRHHEPLPLGGGRSVAAATVPVLVVLKMSAYLDRPGERESDLSDLCHVLDTYLPDDDMRRFEPPLAMLDLDHELQPAWALGADIRAIASPVHMRIVTEFLQRVSDQDDWHFARMLRSWRRGAQSAPDNLALRLQALRSGLDETT